MLVFFYFIYFNITVVKNLWKSTCFKKTKHAKFSKKREFLTPWYAYIRVRIRGNKCSFSQKIYCTLFSWSTRFEIHPLALLPTKCPFMMYFQKTYAVLVLRNFLFCGKPFFRKMMTLYTKLSFRAPPFYRPE